MFLLMIAAICLSSIGGLSVAAVIPNSEINLSAGVVQTFNVLITHFNSSLEWAVRIIAALLLLGVLAEIASDCGAILRDVCRGTERYSAARLCQGE